VQDQRKGCSVLRVLHAVSVVRCCWPDHLAAACCDHQHIEYPPSPASEPASNVWSALHLSIRLPFILEGAVAAGSAPCWPPCWWCWPSGPAWNHYLEPNFQFTAWISWSAVSPRCRAVPDGVGVSSLVSAITTASLPGV